MATVASSALPPQQAKAALGRAGSRLYLRDHRLGRILQLSATPPDIFISYAREDVEWVRPLAAELGSLGRSVFWDRRIPAGESWHSHIGTAVRGARCVVVVWSAQSIESEWVLEEAGQGKRRRVLVPVLKEAVEPPLGFGLIQAADLAHWRRGEPSEEFAGFLGDLARLLDPGLTAVPSTAGPLDPVEPASIQPVPAMLEPARQGESVEGSEATGADDTDISGTATPATSAGAGAASSTGEHLADDTVLLPVAGPSIGLDKHRARVAEQPALAYPEQGQTRDDRCGDARRPSTRTGADGSPSLSVAHSATRTAPWSGRRRKWLAGVALVATLGVAAAPHVVSRFRPELPASALGGRSSVGEVATSSGRPATELSATAKSPAPAREEPDIPQSPDDHVTEIESLGITVASLSVLQRQKYGIDSNTTGILVTKVDESSSAAGESIEPGDVIQEVGQEEVNSPQEMARMVQVARDKGKRSLLLLMNRADDLRFVAIRFAESPPVANMMTSPNSIAEESSTIQSLTNGIVEIAAVGITATPLQKPQRPKYGLEHSQAGVLIAKVVEGSSAKDEELKSGDVIQEINQEEVVSPQEAANKIKSAQDQGKRSILMLINREGDLRFVALRLE